MPTVAEMLRNARLAEHLTINDLSERTKIRPGILEQLERGDYDALPGSFYALNFVRLCARELGVDEEETVNAARAELPDFEDVPLPAEDVMPSQSVGYFVGRANSRFGDAMRRNTAAAGKLLVAAILIGGGSFWLYSSYRSMPPQDAVAAETQEEVAPAETGGISESPEDPSAIAETVPAGPPGSFSVEIRATDRVWVRSLADGVTERERILVSGESQQFRANSLVYATLGNAGGVELVLDGERQDPVGDPGEVRHIRITADGWDAVPPGQF